MNFIKNYLKTNNQLPFISAKVFKNQPLFLDHIAHRTFKNDNVCSQYTKLDNLFKLQNDRYRFKKHNAYAEWWDYLGNKFESKYCESLLYIKGNVIGTPKIFISTYAGANIDKNIQDLDLDHINYCINNPDKKIPYDLYRSIYERNQYLAWTLVHRNKINHVGLSVRNIEFIASEISKYIPLNNPDAPIQVSEDGNLLQFSTQSHMDKFTFLEGDYFIPFDFVEFVERKNNRKGFSEKNANIVFDSTKRNN